MQIKKFHRLSFNNAIYGRQRVHFIAHTEQDLLTVIWMDSQWPFGFSDPAVRAEAVYAERKLDRAAFP